MIIPNLFKFSKKSPDLKRLYQQARRAEHAAIAAVFADLLDRHGERAA